MILASAPTRIPIPPTNKEIFVLPGGGPECDSGRCICASACALIWFGAVGRYGSVGLHRPRTDDPYFKALDPTAAADAYRRALNSIRQYLDEMEEPKPMIEAMVSTGSADIKWVNADDDLDRPPSLAEWEDANCGGFSVENQKSESDLYGRRSNLTQKEHDLLHKLDNRRSQWEQCKDELLASHRDSLPPP